MGERQRKCMWNMEGVTLIGLDINALGNVIPEVVFLFVCFFYKGGLVPIHGFEKQDSLNLLIHLLLIVKVILLDGHWAIPITAYCSKKFFVHVCNKKNTGYAIPSDLTLKAV